jgi:glycosyltransferase involved in cell wall biosynthesis
MNKQKNIIFIPMFNCETQISRVLEKFDNEVCSNFDEILIVDNRSTDRSIEIVSNAAKNIKGITVTIVKNVENYNLGGSHKVAFNYAVDHDYNFLVIVHGDDQGDIRDIIPVMKENNLEEFDCILGSRFMFKSKLKGYSYFRIFGNLGINLVGSLLSRRIIKDMGAGLNLYNVKMLKSKFYLNFPNGLTFNYYLLFYTVAKQLSFKFFPLSWREDDQVSNLNLFNHVKEWLGVLKKFLFHRNDFLEGTEEARDYKFEHYSG